MTLDGKDLPAGAIRFVPTDGQAPTAGAQIVNGAYAADVAVGEVRVEITAPRPKARPGPAKPNSAEDVEESVPARYNTRSDLKFSVAAGTNAKDFELTGK